MRLSAGALALIGSAAFAADSPDPQPARAPVPAWVKPVAIPSSDPAQADVPAQVLLLGGQTRIDARGTDTYFEMVIKPQTVAGLQGFSTIALPWNVARTGLTVHAIEALRDGKPIDLIKDAAFTILRRETKLENSQIDGVRTVVLPAKGIELGDIIRISATYRENHSDLTPRADDLGKGLPPFQVALMDRRVIVAPGVQVKWRAGGRAPKPTISTTSEGTEYRFVLRSFEPAKYAKHMRERDKADEIQFSAYRDWAEVVAGHVALYDSARRTAPSSPLALEADKIARATADPRERMMAALRLTQERVRYIAMLLGEGAYRPIGADEAWESRFGDCKAKTALLLALLDRLGVKADPMYVNAESGDVIVDRLPSLETFDHVVVKAVIDGRNYYLDGTDYGHRVPSDVAASYFAFGLPVVAGATLEKVPHYVAPEPTVMSDLEWNGAQGLTGEVPFKVRLTLRGPMAIQARAKKSSSEKTSDFEKFLKDYVPSIANDSLTIAGQTDDPKTGDYVVEFTGKADMEWGEYQGRKGIRFAFSNNASKWDAEFDRSEGPFKDARVVLNPAFWQREIETVILPATKDFKIDDPEPIDRKVAGSHIWRTVTMDGNRVTSVANFRHLEADIAAEEARRAEEELEAISENWAYLTGPRSLRPAKQRD